jgi:mannose-1-phosphate guanylyltransferase
MIYAIVMAGGSGTRFWPVSVQKRPKQLLRLAGDKSMIRATVERILPLAPFDRVMVVTGASHADALAAELPEVPPDMIIAEPMGRNTAPCIALAAYRLRSVDPDAVMVVLAADHLIVDEPKFLDAVQRAVDTAKSGEWLITFGVVPDRAETGYGYIKLKGRPAECAPNTPLPVERFVEKPDRATAEAYLASGAYLWNSGMFVWKVSDIVAACERFLPEMSALAQQAADGIGTRDQLKAMTSAYERMTAESIDTGVMEKAPNVLCIPIDVGWNDVGSWPALEHVWPADESGNYVRGELAALDATGCVVSVPDKVTAIIGLDDLIVVDTPHALLVCPKNRAQDVKKIQKMLEERGRKDAL